MEKLIKLDGIIGVKFTLTDFYSLHRIKELNGGDINVINGPDEMLLCGLSMGADAGIGSTYNVLCSDYVKLYDLFMKGDIRAAQEQQYKINKVVTLIIKYGVIRSIKYILTLLGIDSGEAVFPGTPLTDVEKASLKQELTDIGYFS
jgi:N-acetylneuraminate lyase